MSIVDLFIEEKSWLIAIPQEKLLARFEAILNAVPSIFEKEINVLLTDDENIRKINMQFRGIDKATNVLSFPQYSQCEINSFHSDEKILLGDIVMAYNVINSEALMFGKTLYDRVSHLFVHGVLHTLGYDHITAFDRHKMENLEIQILSSFNIENPYIFGGNI